MNQWSRRRKRIVLTFVLLILIFLIGLPTLFLFYRAPTCFDGKWNGNETGIDCGGSCELLCTAESLPLLLKGDPRLLRVNDDTFELVAVVENPNTNGEIYRAGYTFTIYSNSSSTPVRVVEGETYVPKASTFSIYEGPFTIDEGIVPSRVTFIWKEDSLIWQQGLLQTSKLTVNNPRLSGVDVRPRLEATVENASLEDISNIELIALVENNSGTIFAASKTFIDRLPSGESMPVVFTWPAPFTDVALDTTIMIRILPDRSFVQ